MMIYTVPSVRHFGSSASPNMEILDCQFYVLCDSGLSCDLTELIGRCPEVPNLNQIRRTVLLAAIT